MWRWVVQRHNQWLQESQAQPAGCCCLPDRLQPASCACRGRRLPCLALLSAASAQAALPGQELPPPGGPEQRRTRTGRLSWHPTCGENGTLHCGVLSCSWVDAAQAARNKTVSPATETPTCAVKRQAGASSCGHARHKPKTPTHLACRSSTRRSRSRCSDRCCSNSRCPQLLKAPKLPLCSSTTYGWRAGRQGHAGLGQVPGRKSSEGNHQSNCQPIGATGGAGCKVGKPSVVIAKLLGQGAACRPCAQPRAPTCLQQWHPVLLQKLHQRVGIVQPLDRFQHQDAAMMAVQKRQVGCRPACLCWACCLRWPAAARLRRCTASGAARFQTPRIFPGSYLLLWVRAAQACPMSSRALAAIPRRPASVGCSWKRCTKLSSRSR